MATHPTQYAHPEALVETDWLEKHLKDEGIRIVESNEDILLYDTGHIPGAVHIDWRADLQDPLIRDYISPEKFARLCSRHGITPDTTCIFYGDKANWWACYALWAFRLFGHEKVKILNGGRDKWKAEVRPMTRETATNDDATFKPAGELAKIYFDQCGLKPGTDTVVYCRIGERSSHTWFVLTYLLGLHNVRNYDGSWTEWGNKVGAPIEKSA